jgi:hypothetical protein
MAVSPVVLWALAAATWITVLSCGVMRGRFSRRQRADFELSPLSQAAALVETLPWSARGDARDARRWLMTDIDEMTEEQEL